MSTTRINARLLFLLCLALAPWLSGCGHTGHGGGKGSAEAYTGLVPAPVDFAAASVSDTEVHLTWRSVAAVSGFRLERAFGPSGGTFTPIWEGQGNEFTYTDTDVVKGNTYRYRIYALSMGMESPPSTEVVVIPGEQNTPIIPPTPTPTPTATPAPTATPLPLIVGKWTAGGSPCNMELTFNADLATGNNAACPGAPPATSCHFTYTFSGNVLSIKISGGSPVCLGGGTQTIDPANPKFTLSNALGSFTFKKQ